MENELLRQPYQGLQAQRKPSGARPCCSGAFGDEATDALGIDRPHVSATARTAIASDAELVADIRLLVADLLTYGHGRMHAGPRLPPDPEAAAERLRRTVR